MRRGGRGDFAISADPQETRGELAFPPWAEGRGFRRVGILSKDSLDMPEDIAGGCVYLWVRQNAPLYVGECGGSLRVRLRGFFGWLRASPERRAAVLREALADAVQIWARPAGIVRVLDGSVTDRHAVLRIRNGTAVEVVSAQGSQVALHPGPTHFSVGTAPEEAEIVQGDIACSDGVIHKIDDVLVR